jgi:magnesium transporter
MIAMLRILVRREGQCTTDVSPDRISELIDDPEAVVWVDMMDPGLEELRCLKEEFQFHPLSLEDVARHHQRPKVEVYPMYYYMVVYTLAYPDSDTAIRIDELDIFLGPNYMVTVHDHELAEVNDTWDRWLRKADVGGSNVGSLLYLLADNIVDQYFPVIDVLAERIEDLEARIFERFDTSALESIFQLKKDLLALRRVIAPERDVFNVLLRRDPPILAPETVVYFQDVYDHTLRVLDSVDTYRELLSSALDAFLSVQSNKLNEVMRRLTIISTIFLPLTFLTGFFGMNFEHLPFASEPVMWVALAIMVLMPMMMVVYFRWKGWD